MSHTTVRAHTRRGYQVRAHSRRTVGGNVQDVLARDGERAIERAQARLSGECQHAGQFLAYHETGVTFFVCRCCQRHIDYSQMHGRRKVEVRDVGQGPVGTGAAKPGAESLVAEIPAWRGSVGGGI